LLSKWPIRNKLLFGIGCLVVIVATLSISGFTGVYAYRALARSLRGRAEELPMAGALARGVSDLRVIVSEARTIHDVSTLDMKGERILGKFENQILTQRFHDGLSLVQGTLDEYRLQLIELAADNPRGTNINDSSAEWETVHKIEDALAVITEASDDADWPTKETQLVALSNELEKLQQLTWVLPSYLHERIHGFADEVKGQYRALIGLTWVSTILAVSLLFLVLRLFYTWVFRPLRVLVKGARRVAAGEFGYRIKLETRDEIGELADAMNDTTARFEAIRDDLDRQVRERTKQVVRSEQLASVGFLAAGVAHEINNPLQSIALCGESLQSRVEEVLEAAPTIADADRDCIRNYLRMIQDEAFRCKGITERLLDFSRMGDVNRQSTDLRELIQGVIDMVGHLGRYHDKRLELMPGDPLIAPVNSQELKQVVLNLITNGLDSLSPGGLLSIELNRTRDTAEIVFTDDGCGMSEEVLKHLFEPFFTRKRSGQGTGLGLSITYRIVADHGGQIDVHSDGPGRGSRFRVSLPLAEKQKERDHRYQAA
jgi:signal transduction histidine kinase